MDREGRPSGDVSVDVVSCRIRDFIQGAYGLLLAPISHTTEIHFTLPKPENQVVNGLDARTGCTCSYREYKYHDRVIEPSRMWLESMRPLCIRHRLETRKKPERCPFRRILR